MSPAAKKKAKPRPHLLEPPANSRARENQTVVHPSTLYKNMHPSLVECQGENHPPREEERTGKSRLLNLRPASCALPFPTHLAQPVETPCIELQARRRNQIVQ